MSRLVKSANKLVKSANKQVKSANKLVKSESRQDCIENNRMIVNTYLQL